MCDAGHAKGDCATPFFFFLTADELPRSQPPPSDPARLCTGSTVRVPLSPPPPPAPTPARHLLPCLALIRCEPAAIATVGSPRCQPRQGDVPAGPSRRCLDLPSPRFGDLPTVSSRVGGLATYQPQTPNPSGGGSDGDDDDRRAAEATRSCGSATSCSRISTLRAQCEPPCLS